jgi:HlyD family secretion protein
MMDVVLRSPAALAPHQGEVRRLVRAGLLVLALGVIPIGWWVATAPLAAAVVAPAVVKVDLNRRPVQHAEGGLVREVRVRDGQRVAQGEPLVLLGDVSVEADMMRWAARVRAERASIARLDAEQSMAPTVDFGRDLIAAARDDAELAQLLGKERALFAARRSALVSQVQLLREGREKAGQEVRAMQAQIERASQALAHQSEELDNNRRLAGEGFVSSTRVTQLQAQVADYGVKLEERRSELARAEQKVVDIDLRIKALESDYRQQASDALKVTLARLAEIQQEERKTADAANRQVIAAPVAGEVMGLVVTAPGAVIGPRQTVAEIVPAETELVVEAMVRPEDIQGVWQGQHADIRFTAFTYRTTRLVRGTVKYVAADRMVDRETGTPFYVVHIGVDPKSLAEAGDLPLQAGMPAEVYIKDRERTVLQYMLEPLTALGRRAARER